MPTVTQREVTAYAHCIQARCRGHQQEEVSAVRTEDSYTYAEQGGNLAGEERSFVRLNFADPEQSHCEHCGGNRELSDTPRRRYANLSGHNPEGLLDIEPFDPAKQHEPMSSTERQAYEDRERELRDRLSNLEGMMTAFVAQQAPALAHEDETEG